LSSVRPVRQEKWTKKPKDESRAAFEGEFVVSGHLKNEEGPAILLAGPTGSRRPRADRFRSRLSDLIGSDALPAGTGAIANAAVMNNSQKVSKSVTNDVRDRVPTHTDAACLRRAGLPIADNIGVLFARLESVFFFFDAIAVGKMAAIFLGSLLRVFPRFECAADRFRAASKAAFGIVAAMVTPNNNFKFRHVDFSP
jgi:hypothetical protein